MVGYSIIADKPGGFVVSLEASEFDGVLTVWDEDNLVVAGDDDSGLDVNPWLVFVAPEAGSYIVGVSSFFGGTGSYELSVSSAPQHSFTAVAGGEMFDGITVGSFKGQEVAYSIDLEADQPVLILLSSASFDTYLTLFDPAGFEAASDDDSGGNLNSRLAYVPIETGEFTIVVSSFDGMEAGQFSLSVFDVEAPEVDDIGFNLIGPINVFDVVTGYSSMGVIDIYTMEMTAGQTVVISLDSNDFDPLIEVMSPGGAVVADDDDSGGDLNALLTFTASVAGEYVIGVTSYALEDGEGAYTLSVSQ